MSADLRYQNAGCSSSRRPHEPIRKNRKYERPFAVEGAGTVLRWRKASPSRPRSTTAEQSISPVAHSLCRRIPGPRKTAVSANANCREPAGTDRPQPLLRASPRRFSCWPRQRATAVGSALAWHRSSAFGFVAHRPPQARSVRSLTQTRHDLIYRWLQSPNLL